MSLPFIPEQVPYTPSIKTRKKNNKRSNIVTTNNKGNKVICLPFPRSNVSNQTIEQLILDPSLIESYKRFIHDRILNADENDFLEKLAAYGYGDSAIYTWILKSKDPNRKTIEEIDASTPVSFYMTKIISPQEIGTLHRDLDFLHPRDSLEDMPVIGAGELKVASKDTIVFNLLSGTYMEKLLKKKSKKNRDSIENTIKTLFATKLQRKGFTVQFNDNLDLVEGTSFITPKETMNTLRRFFKPKNNNTKKIKSKSTENISAPGAGAGTDMIS